MLIIKDDGFVPRIFISTMSVLFRTLLIIVGGLLVACSTQTPIDPALSATDAWARPVAPEAGGVANGAVYLVVRNTGQQADRLIGARANIAGTVEIHQTVRDGDVMKMQPVPEGVVVPAGGTVEFKPGGYHLMLIGIEEPLVSGDQFEITLRFERSDSVTLTVDVGEP